MSDLKLGPRHVTDYGNRYDGRVREAGRVIDVTLREPKRQRRSDWLYVMLNGLGGGKNSMRLPALEAVHAGHTAVTFDYSNHGIKHALRQNAEDARAVIDALTPDQRVAGIGLSMGGWILTKTLGQTNRPIERATLVAPAGYMSRNPSAREVVQHFAAVTPEAIELALSDPINALHLSAGSLRNYLKRPLAVPAELYELVHGDVHEHLKASKASPQSPHVRFMYGSRDQLIPAWAQTDGIQGLPFDEVISYDAGHLSLTKHPALSQQIFANDSYLNQAPAMPLAA